MKTPHLLLLAAAFALSSCAAPSDGTFMQNAAAGINGGLIATPSGAMMATGVNNRNRVHPFFGTP